MRTFSWADFASLFAAMQWTVALVCIALAVGAPLGLGLALLRGHRLAPLRWLAAALQQLVQGVPLLGLLMFFYFGMPVFLGVEVPAIAAVSVAFIIYAAAFLGQIWHGGIQAVKHEQWEAAACLGLSKWHQFRHVIAPQALRLSPAHGGLPGPADQGHLAGLGGGLRRTRARRPDRQRRHLPAAAGLFMRRAAVLRGVPAPDDVGA